ncbi:hypothetical protein E0H26_19180 [Micromonospora zingiberis]|uniref:Uncharacterized protein n=1 Tax=Micromonospora zingiberis TaxID=2053011 RepID=A0A4R0GG42_9ACTN|nr:hypothetical protein [Micromonospora zingiberis]TCB95587.1 hypothetical protein E0H26_19180 [Micromonospora zingiberis]
MSAVGAGELEILFEELLTEVNQLLDEVQQDINELAAGLTEVMRWLPAVVTTGMRWAWDKFLVQSNKIFDEVQKFIAQPGLPPALFRLGEYWDLHVGTPVSGLEQAVSAYGMKADNRWTGSAASAYADSADAQSRAVKAIKPMAERIQNVLSDLAWGLISFWAGIAAAFVTFVVGIAAATGLLASLIGAPAAPVEAGATAAVVVGLITSVVLVSIAYVETRSTNLTTIQQALNDNGGLVQQGSQWGWPRVDPTASEGRWRVAD